MSSVRTITSTVFLILLYTEWTAVAKPTPTASPANVGDSRMWYIPVLSGQPGPTSDLCCDNSTREVLTLKDKVCQLIDLVNTTRNDSGPTSAIKLNILLSEVRRLREEVNEQKTVNTAVRPTANPPDTYGDSLMQTTANITQTLGEVIRIIKILNEEVKDIKVDIKEATMKTIMHKVVYEDCADAYRNGHNTSGVYLLQVSRCGHPFPVYCQMTEEEQWIVFQRRLDGSISFFRRWDDYVAGFGDLEGEHWLGLQKISCLTQARSVLRVDLEAFNGDIGYAEYNTFQVGSDHTKYILTVGGHSGSLVDRLAYHNGHHFTTYDRDNDNRGDLNCAQAQHGGWWYRSCHDSNLNGLYLPGQDRDYSANWHQFGGGSYVSLKLTEMKIHF